MKYPNPKASRESIPRCQGHGGDKVAVPPGPNHDVGGTAAALSNIKVVEK